VYRAVSKYVCGRCFGNEGLVEFCRDHAEKRKCDFCSVRYRHPAAAPLDDVLDHVRSCVFQHFDNPDNAGLSFDSEDGEYQGITYSTDEIFDSLGLDFSRDRSGTLTAYVMDKLGNDLWCDADPHGLTPSEQLRYSWEHFCEVIKHQRRYFFFADGAGPGQSSELFSPNEILEQIFAYAEEAGAFAELPAGTLIYRARYQPKGRLYNTALQLGPPPSEFAIQTNRMSPPGIVMTYASEDHETAIAETVSETGTYAIGHFVTERAALLLDLTDLPAPPSLFSELPDSSPYDPRPRLQFLHNVSEEISRPIARDDRIHIEYIPTQVVTEYVRTFIRIGERAIDGIRYKSSRNPEHSALVLFADQGNLILEGSERGEWYSLATDRWVRLENFTTRRRRKRA